ncbi:MAG: gamma-glutamyltransferase family protein [Gammaproteobacteria bacterium]
MTAFDADTDFARRPPAIGRRGMVATSQPLATAAGRDVLAAGGSALDAAIAANAVLAVTEPHMCGPGGDLFAMVWDPAARRLHGLNASGRSPAGLSYATLREALGAATVIPGRGPATLTTPGAVRGWAALHARFGRLPWAALFAPAIDAARHGFAVGVRTSLWWARAAQEIVQEPRLQDCLDGFRRTFLADGRVPRAGQAVANPAMARLFERIAAEGAEGFYHGEVAAAVARTARAAGGWLAEADLASHEVEWVTPLHTDYRGARVHVLPPNGQGLSVLQMLNILAECPGAAAGPADPAWWHLFLEAKKLVFADRARYYADPAFARLPLARLASREYAATRAARIDPERARADQTPGDVHVPDSDTTYLATADADGQMVSLIQSLFVPFGSGLTVPEFGFALQSRGSGFALTEGHANVFAPAKRPFHTIMPGFVTRQGEAFLAFGAIGGDMQPQAQVQILSRILDGGMDVARGGALPRLRHLGGASPNGAAEAPLGIASCEREMPGDVIATLVRRGHAVQVCSDPLAGFVGGYQAIMRDPATGALWGASDHRLDGCALGL